GRGGGGGGGRALGWGAGGACGGGDGGSGGWGDQQLPPAAGARATRREKQRRQRPMSDAVGDVFNHRHRRDGQNVARCASWAATSLASRRSLAPTSRGFQSTPSADWRRPPDFDP